MENKRILILSANTGEGHNSAARALAESFAARGWECVQQDGLAFLPRFLNRLICRGHIFLYRRLPKLSGMGYRLAEICTRHQKAPVHSRKINKKLLAFLEEGRFDNLVCAHVFAAKMVSNLRLSGRISLPCYFLATDYTCSPMVNNLDMDAWFIPHRNLFGEFASAGVPKDRIIATGIPVCGEFLRKNGRSELRKKLELPENKRIAALSCGSMGAGDMDRLVSALIKELPEDALLIALCGSNTALRDRLNRRIHSEKLLALGFVESLAEYMEAADVYLTKPGGLSTTEAMHKGVPTLLFNAVPGLETRNMEFLGSIGCAASAADLNSFVKLVRHALENGGFAQSITKNRAEHFDGLAAHRICQYIEKELSV